MADQPLDASGHRSRLRARLLDQGGDALGDYEIVEYLLALAIPRRDTKPLAKLLLQEFGGLGALLSAEAVALQRVAGMGETSAAAIKVVHAAMVRVLKVAAGALPVMSSAQAIIDYLRADMAFIGVERVRALYLNSKNILVRDEVLSEGSLDEAQVHVREVVRRAMEVRAASLILVHNHPSGDPTPSRAGIQLTRDIIEACRRLSITVHDHIIVAADGHSSLRQLGLI